MSFGHWSFSDSFPSAGAPHPEPEHGRPRVSFFLNVFRRESVPPPVFTCLSPPHLTLNRAHPAVGLPDLNEAFLMEHLWHAIFGQPLIMPPQRADETCAVARCGKYCPNPATPELGMFGTSDAR